jgi:small subunit ribosomal protein S17
VTPAKEQAMTEQTTRSSRKVRIGEVVKAGADKTIVVAVRRRVTHPTYGKIVNRTSKLMAHDEKNECGVGDVVRVMETRPLSKRKRWRYLETVRKAQ